MARIEQHLAEVVDEVIVALADETTGAERDDLLRRLDVLKRLDLSNPDWSAADFLRTEVERALGN
jgi:hypothetical protein